MWFPSVYLPDILNLLVDIMCEVLAILSRDLFKYCFCLICLLFFPCRAVTSCIELFDSHSIQMISLFLSLILCSLCVSVYVIVLIFKFTYSFSDMSVLLFRCSNELFISGFLWFIAFTFSSFSSAKTYISFVHTCFPLESWTFLSSLFKYFCLVISISEQSVPWFLLTFFLELSYIFFFAHLIIFTWMLDVTCGRTVETDGCGKVDPSLHQAIAVGTTQRIAGLMLSFQRCDCECGPWLVRGCWDGAVSLWLSAPWAALSHLCPALEEHAVHLLKAPCIGWGWWASSPLSCVSPGVLAAFSVHPTCARAGVGVKPGLRLTPGSWVWGEPSVCKKQVHYLLRDSYALSSVGTQKSS